MLAATFLSILFAKAQVTRHSDVSCQTKDQVLTLSTRACQAGLTLGCLSRSAVATFEVGPSKAEKLKKLSFSKIHTEDIAPQKANLDMTTAASVNIDHPVSVQKVDQGCQVKPTTRDMNFQSITLPRGEDLYLENEKNEVINELINPFLDDRLIELSDRMKATFERRTSSEECHTLGFVLEEDEESGDESEDYLGYETLSEVSFPSLNDDDSNDENDDVDELIASLPSRSSSESCRAYMSDHECSTQASASLDDLKSLPDFEVYDDGVMADDEVEKEQEWDVQQVQSVV